MKKPLLILGEGVSGRAAAKLAQREGYAVSMASESRPPQQNQQGDVIISPGFPADHPWLESFRSQNRQLLPEFEFAASRLQGQQIAITGSLGKTSMILLAAELLRSAGYKVTVSGNIGTPVSDIALEESEADFHLIELSSFQLEATKAYRPDRALCLNLFPNHLDRHLDMKTYAEAKARLFAFQTAKDVAVWPNDYPLSIQSKAQRNLAEDVELPSFGNPIFNGSALRKNLQGLFAVLEGISGINAFNQKEMIDGFVLPPHRMESLAILGAGVVFDDSKSTCLSSTRGALESISGPIQLVMGGIDKNESFETLTALLHEKNPRLYLFGHSAKKMGEAWQDSVDECRMFDTLTELLPALWEGRSKAETLLFSPGCASFDQYPGYVARGEHFKQLIRQLGTQSPI